MQFYFWVEKIPMVLSKGIVKSKQKTVCLSKCVRVLGYLYVETLRRQINRRSQDEKDS